MRKQVWRKYKYVQDHIFAGDETNHTYLQCDSKNYYSTIVLDCFLTHLIAVLWYPCYPTETAASRKNKRNSNLPTGNGTCICFSK